MLDLAKEGKVCFAGVPINALLEFYMLCVTQGEEPCVSNDYVVSDEMGIQALEQLRELSHLFTTEMYQWDPRAVYEAMSTREDLFYCPFAYGYTNYSRPGYAAHLLKSTDLVTMEGYGPLITTLGGTGIAISNQCKELDAALDYAMYTASPHIQKTIFFDNGGQPGHRLAWMDEEVNRRCLDFFKDTLSAHDRAYVRPRYPGYFHFQDHAGDVIRDYNMNGGDPRQVMVKLNTLYQESKAGESS